MKFEDLTTEDQKGLRESFDGQRKTLLELYTLVVTNAEKYLLFINAGGAAALLSFMGASEKVREHPVAWWALGCYFTGLIAVGVIHSLSFHTVRRMLSNTVARMNLVYRNDITLEEYTQVPGKPPQSTTIAGYVAFGSFVIGTVIAMTGMMPH